MKFFKKFFSKLDIPLISKAGTTNEQLESIQMSGIIQKQHNIEISTILVNTNSNTASLTMTNDITITPRPASSTTSQQNHTSWLLRFFESKHFDMSIAISYLFNTKEPGVQTYLCNRLFTFTNKDVDFYLPQLLNIYIYCCNESNEQLIADMLNTYFRTRCSCKLTGIDFSLRCSWLLDAHINDNAKLALTTKESRARRGLNNAVKLYKLIISERLRPPRMSDDHDLKEEPLQIVLENENNCKKVIDCETKSVDDLDVSSDEATNSGSSNCTQKEATNEADKRTLNNNSNLIKTSHLSTSRSSLNYQNLNYFTNNNVSIANNAIRTHHSRTHNRTKSDTTSSIVSQAINRCNSVTSLKVTIGDLMSGRAFDNNCSCIDKLIQTNCFLTSNLLSTSNKLQDTNLNGIDEEHKLEQSSSPSSSSSSYSLSVKDKNEQSQTEIQPTGQDCDLVKHVYSLPPLQTFKFDCNCNAPRLAPEFEFTKALIHIGRKLIRLSSKELKSNFKN